MTILQKISESLQAGNLEEVREFVEVGLEEGLAPGDILAGGLVAGMEVVGRKFKSGELFIPEVLIRAGAMHAGLDILEPYLSKSDSNERPKIVIGTVVGDIHDIGKNIVGMMLKGVGYQVIDIGINCPPEKFVQAASENDVKIVAMSALLSTTMPQLAVTIDALTRAGLTEQIKTIVGGAPVSEAFANSIGAAGYAPDAGAAVDLVRDLLAT